MMQEKEPQKIMTDKSTQVENNLLLETLVPLAYESPESLRSRKLSFKVFLDSCHQLWEICDHISTTSPNVIDNMTLMSELFPAYSYLLLRASKTSIEVVACCSKMKKMLPKIEVVLLVSSPTMKQQERICRRLASATLTLKQIISILHQHCMEIWEIYCKAQKSGEIEVPEETHEIASMQYEVSFHITETFLELLELVMSQLESVWRISGNLENRTVLEKCSQAEIGSITKIAAIHDSNKLSERSYLQSTSPVQSGSIETVRNISQIEENEGNAIAISTRHSSDIEQTHLLPKQTSESQNGTFDSSLNRTAENDENFQLHCSPVSLRSEIVISDTEVSFSHPPVQCQKSDEELEEEKTQESKQSKQKSRRSAQSNILTASRTYLTNFRRIFSTLRKEISKHLSMTRSP